jgi:hypothetical protein
MFGPKKPKKNRLNRPENIFEKENRTEDSLYDDVLILLIMLF